MKIKLYDTDKIRIGSGSLSSGYVHHKLIEANGADVEVHISSVGGSYFDAIAIYDLLKRYRGNVTIYVDSLAAGAASVVAMGGNKIIMSKYALLMIHKPIAKYDHPSDTLLTDTQMLNVVQGRVSKIFEEKTGLDGVTVNSLINSVTWLTADQCLDLNFIDLIEDFEPVSNNKEIIKDFTKSAPSFYQRFINNQINKPIKKTMWQKVKSALK